MCGIVGYIDRETSVKGTEKLIAWFQQALLCDSLRGKHGTGVAAVDNKGEVNLYKRAIQAADFLELSTANKIINNKSNTFVIGHNRWATHGTHTSDNSHPFSHNHIHLVHNGGVNYYQTLNKGASSFNVDSDAVAYLLAHSEDTIEALEKLEGTYALVWYDELEETLNFARNSERPMFLATIKDSQSILYASEEAMLKWLASRNGITIKSTYELTAGKLVSVPLDSKEKWRHTKFTPKKSITTYTTYSRVGGNTISNTTYSMIGKSITFKIDKWCPYPGNVGNNGFLSGVYNSIKIVISSIKEEDSHKYVGKEVSAQINSINNLDCCYAKIIEIVQTAPTNLPAVVTDIASKRVKGPNGLFIPYNRFKELVKHGCSICSSDIETKDADVISWDHQENPYCEDCAPILDYNQDYIDQISYRSCDI